MVAAYSSSKPYLTIGVAGGHCAGLIEAKTQAAKIIGKCRSRDEGDRCPAIDSKLEGFGQCVDVADGPVASAVIEGSACGGSAYERRAAIVDAERQIARRGAHEKRDLIARVYAIICAIL